uniref:Uncharacterized protein n=1 Tax=Oscillatoriales cyanobacterium SpSt-402 TaxID=2282168 RepID=A0A832H5V1_9CYAN
MQYLANLQLARGTYEFLLEQLESILPDFDETGTDVLDLLLVMLLLSEYCGPTYELDCLVELALGIPIPAEQRPAWQPTLDLIKPAVRLKLISDLVSRSPGFDATTAQGMALEDIWNGAPFRYDRAGAAQLAITRSQDNFEQTDNGVYFFKSGTGNQLTGVPLGVSPGPSDIAEGRLRYSTLTHQTGSTGSAYFMSEMLHFGGKLPMFVCDADDSNCDPEALLVADMWLARCGGGPNLEATSSWRDHRFLMQYFVEQHNAIALTNSSNTVEERERDTIFFQHPSNSAISDPSSLDPTDSQFVEDDMSRYMNFNNGGIWKSGYANVGATFLNARFGAEGLADIDTGDYMFLDLGTDVSSHGFLIVGWGDPVDSPVGINTKIGRNNFSLDRQPNKIPYVADFAYGYNPTTNDTGFLQDIRPRPFYSVIASINSTQLAQQLTNLGNPANGFNITQISEYEARLRSGVWRVFSFSSGNLPNFQFFKFTNSSNIVSIPFKQIFKLNLPCG